MKNLFSTRLISINLLFFCIFVLGISGQANAQFYNEIGIQHISPNEGTKGTVITITGKGFGDNVGEVRIGKGKCIVEEWCDTELVCKYLSLKSPAGIYDVVITTVYGETIVSENGFELMVPEVNPLSVSNGVEGNKIVVTGKYFGTKNCNLKILGRLPGVVNGWMINKPESWTMDVVTGESHSSFKVPPSIPSGTYSFEMRVENAFGVSNIVKGLFTLGQVEPCGNGVYEGDYTITDAASLQGLADYTEVTGDLSIVDTSLEIIDGLECLTTVGGSLIISENDDLTTLNFSSLTTVGGNLSINNNLQLCESVAEGFSEQIIVSGTIEIHDNRDCNIVEPCGNGVYEGDYMITDAASLQGLANYTEVTGDLAIFETSLEIIDGLECLTTVGGSLILSGNDSLTTMDFSSLTTVGVGISIDYNEALIAMDFNSLTTVGQDLLIEENNVLELISFNSLITVGGGIGIDYNESLIAMDFNSLTSVEQELWIEENDVLEAMDFSSLISVGAELWIIDNPQLCNSIAISLSDQVTIGGEQDIEGNRDC